MKYMAWVGPSIIDFSGKRTVTKSYPNTERGLLNASKALYKMRVKSPADWEWGIWAVIDGGFISSCVVYMDPALLARIKGECIEHLARQKASRDS
jgi:hypothetical protein